MRTDRTWLVARRSVDSMHRRAARPYQSRIRSRPHGSARGSWRSLTAALAFVVLAGSGCAASDTAEEPAQSQDTPAAASAPTQIADPSTVRDAIEGGAKVIDVRTPEEFAAGHLQGAMNIDLAADDFEQRTADLDMTTSYVVYCASGNRAGTAIEAMTEQGFDQLMNGGGYEDLAAEGLPTN